VLIGMAGLAFAGLRVNEISLNRLEIGVSLHTGWTVCCGSSHRGRQDVPEQVEQIIDSLEAASGQS
jgi:hypothetical protein